MIPALFAKHRHAILYGTSLAMLLFLLRWLELRFLVIQPAFKICVALMALIFTGLGIWLASKLARPRVETVIVEQRVVSAEVRSPFCINPNNLQQLGLSPREMDVLELMAAGHSNQEIADALFVSLNTVKTHSSRIFQKLDVKSRTQAIEAARRWQLIP